MSGGLYSEEQLQSFRQLAVYARVKRQATHSQFNAYCAGNDSCVSMTGENVLGRYGIGPKLGNFADKYEAVTHLWGWVWEICTKIGGTCAVIVCCMQLCTAVLFVYRYLGTFSCRRSDEIHA